MQPPHVVDVDPISSSQPIHKNEFCIQIPSKFNQPCKFQEVKIDSKPAQISIPYYIISEPCHQLVNPHVQHTTFQAKIRNRLFKL